MLYVSAQILVTIVFFFVMSMISYVVAKKMLSLESPIIRLLASIVIFAWTLSLLFALLATFNLFIDWYAIAAAALGLVIVRLFAWPSEGMVGSIKDDLTQITQTIKNQGDDLAWWSVFAVLFTFVSLFGVRGLCLPLLGWDTLTYHALKSGLWVQTGGWVSFEAPGGWEYYRTFFGGGEVFTAWAMLFCRSGLFSAMPDIFFWLTLGLSVFCLSRQFDVSSRSALFTSLAIICAPPFSQMVGTGYIDTGAYALLLAGFCLLLCTTQSNNLFALVVASAALGAAASIKINIFAMIVLLFVPLFIVLWILGFRNLRVYLVCMIVFLVPVAPWLIYNTMTYGYPLGSTAFSLGPIVLGKAPPNLVWFLDRPEITPYNLETEWEAFWRSIQHYGPVLVLSVMGIPGILYGLWGRKASHGLGACLLVIAAILFLSPAFAVIRLVWQDWNARFLALIVILPIVMGVSLLTQFYQGRRLIEAFSLLCITTGVYEYCQLFIFTGYFIENWFLAAAVLLALAAYLALNFLWTYRIAARWVGIGTTLLICIAAITLCERFHREFRATAYAECTTMHTFPRYWAPAVKVIDSKDGPLTIAIAYGPTQVSQIGFIAPFLGARLENTLVYVSPDQNGKIPSHGANYFDEIMDGDFNQWLQRLKDKQVDYLLCFRPASNELIWAEENPSHFTRSAGQYRDWGLFEVNINQNIE